MKWQSRRTFWSRNARTLFFSPDRFAGMPRAIAICRNTSKWIGFDRAGESARVVWCISCKKTHLVTQNAKMQCRVR